MTIAFVLVIGTAYFVTKSRTHQRIDWNNPGLNALDGLVRWYCLAFHRLQGDEIDLKEGRAHLIIANHESGIDPLLILAKCRRPVRFIMATEEYEVPVIRRLFAAIGCIPINRNGNPNHGMRRALKALNKGEAVAIFPQGRLPENASDIRRWQPGAKWLIEKSGADVTVVEISGVAGIGETYLALFKRSFAHLAVKSNDILQHSSPVNSATVC